LPQRHQDTKNSLKIYHENTKVRKHESFKIIAIKKAGANPGLVNLMAARQTIGGYALRQLEKLILDDYALNPNLFLISLLDIPPSLA
jgi:hypothetical protein